jgi:hypothetical protein
MGNNKKIAVIGDLVAARSRADSFARVYGSDALMRKGVERLACFWQRSVALCCLIVIALGCATSGECQTTVILKNAGKLALKEIGVQVAADSAITTGVDSYANGTFSPGISDPVIDGVPKVLEFLPITGDVIDFVETGRGLWELREMYIAMEQERLGRKRVREIIEKRKANAQTRAQRDKVFRAEWFHSIYRDLLAAFTKYHAARSEAEKDAARQKIAEVLEFARRRAQEEGINNIDFSVLPPDEAEFIGRNFFGAE